MQITCCCCCCCCLLLLPVVVIVVIAGFVVVDLFSLCYVHFCQKNFVIAVGVAAGAVVAVDAIVFIVVLLVASSLHNNAYFHTQLPLFRFLTLKQQQH